ncbi:amidohydrolase [Paenibacillus sp. MMS20-IR301]|uniref:amidohydrolase n=1 Tax=Paenibacillus sp. MMS20-IR301 TaxID=2895946 RepID=UPI0028ECFE26|nr:amidohydrolase [Paenibacillus sp. MMS20-IR301]WNS43487.1 amidohydrolase [Paenibacillus sp. MMS20-IR301]
MEELVGLRRSLHKHPEIAFHELETRAIIKAFVTERAGLFEPFYDGQCGLVFVKRCKDKPKKTVAFRAEMDGLPVKDEKKTDYASLNPGYCHSCGHDAHMAMLLSAMEKINDAELENELVCIFQAGEEVFGGAKYLMEKISNLSIDYLFGMHITPDMKAGSFSIAAGEMMASSYTAEVQLNLACSHVGQGADRLEIFNLLYEAANQFNNDTQLMKIPHIRDNGYYNVNASEITLCINIRSFLEKDWKSEIIKLVKRISDKAALNNATFKEISYYPILINTESATRKATEIIGKCGGNLVEAPRSYSSDDFAFYRNRIKETAYFFIGCYLGPEHQCHTASFDLDESCLAHGEGVIVELFNSTF